MKHSKRGTDLASLGGENHPSRDRKLMQESPKGPFEFGIRVRTMLVPDGLLLVVGTVDGPSVGILASPDGSVIGHVDPALIFEPGREATFVCKGVSVPLSSFVDSLIVELITLVSMVD